jgi:predicted ATPase
MLAHYGHGRSLYARGELASIRAHLEQAIDLYDRGQHHRLAFDYGPDPGLACMIWLSCALWLALIEQGQSEAGIAQMRQGKADYNAAGSEMGHPYQLALLANGYGKMGQAEEGLVLLAEALETVDRTGERYYEAEIHRLKGELLQQAEEGGPNASSESPEACFLKAIEVARRQQARSLELRATMSLCRLWQQQGKATEARQVLEEIYSWFTEGFDTLDLKEARVLLEALT